MDARGVRRLVRSRGRRVRLSGTDRTVGRRGCHPWCALADGSVHTMNRPVSETAATTLPIPEFALVLLVGASGSGKSTFARRHFLPTEVVSSDACRGLVSDEENSLDATDDAFALLHTMVE